MGQPGEKIALPVNGDASYGRDEVCQQMERDGVKVLPALHVDSGQVHWDLLYKPQTREVVTVNRLAKQTISYQPFPEIDRARIERSGITVPLEQGIAEKEALERRLKTAVDIVEAALERRDAELFDRRVESVKDLADWSALAGMIRTPMALLLERAQDQAEGLHFSKRLEDDKRTLAMVDVVLAHPADEEVRSGYILPLCRFAENIAELHSARHDPEHASVARELMERAEKLHEGLSEDMKSSRLDRIMKRAGDAVAALSGPAGSPSPARR